MQAVDQTTPLTPEQMQGLCQSREQAQKEWSDAGRIAGNAWARQAKDWAALTSLQSAVAEAEGLYELLDSEDDGLHPDAALFAALYPDGGAFGVDDFWETEVRASRSQRRSREYAEGFATGAMEVLEQFERQDVACRLGA